MLGRGVARRDHGCLVVVVPTAALAMLYFNRLSVTPDQVWAYRRLLPVITPGILLGAVFVVEWWLRRRGVRALQYAVAAVALVVLAGSPLLAWNGLTGMPEGDGTRTLTSSLCDQLSRDTVLLATGHAPAHLAVTVRVVCGRQVVTGPATSRALLRQVAARASGLQVVAFDRSDLPPGTDLGEPNVEGTIRVWQHTLTRLPDTHVDIPWRIWVGRVEDGRFIQTGPAGATRG
jgi:hypothetical protein